jgi:hypothetical protein
MPNSYEPSGENRASMPWLGTARNGVPIGCPVAMSKSTIVPSQLEVASVL